MLIVECAAAALIAIALGILIDSDTRDMRVRLSNWDHIRAEW
jgi:hypothetical protein